MRDEQRLTRGEPEYEALMTPTVIVVRKDARNNPLADYLNTTPMISEGAGNLFIAGSRA